MEKKFPFEPDLAKLSFAIAILSFFYAVDLAFAHGGGHKSKHRYGHVSKKSGHDHEDSKFSLAFGASVSQSLSSGSNAAATRPSSKQQLSLLDEGHEGHDSGDNADDSSDDAKPGLAPFFGARMTYQATKAYSAILTAGYFTNTGIADPTVGIGAALPFSSRIVGNASLYAAAPVSKVSRDSYKITTVTATAGPTYRQGKWVSSLTSLVAMSWYSKTVIVEEVDEEAANTSGSPLSSFQLLHGDEGHDAGGGASSFPEESEGTGDREFNRYGVRAAGGYKLLKALRFDAGLGLAMVTHQFGPSTWVTDATISQLTYTWTDYSGFIGLALRKEDRSISAPSEPTIGAGVEYVLN